MANDLLDLDVVLSFLTDKAYGGETHEADQPFWEKALELAEIGYCMKELMKLNRRRTEQLFKHKFWLTSEAINLGHNIDPVNNEICETTYVKPDTQRGYPIYHHSDMLTALKTALRAVREEMEDDKWIKERLRLQAEMDEEE